MISFGTSRQNTNPSQVWNQQAPYLQALYGLGLGFAGNQLGVGSGGQAGIQPIGGRPSQAGGGFAPGLNMVGGNGFDWMHPGTWPNTNPTPDPTANFSPVNSMNQPGNPEFNLLMQRATGGSPWLQSQIGSLGQNIGNFLNQQVLPGIDQQASFAGGTGGARQSIGQGLAGQAALQQFQQGASSLYQNDYNQGLTAALNLGQAQWSPLSYLATLLGNPTVLGQGSSGSSFNFGFGQFGSPAGSGKT